MSSLMILLLSVLCVYSLYGPGVHALECYSCTNCNDPFESSNVLTTTCSKSCMKTKGEKDGVQFVLRDCGQSSTENCEKSKYLGVDVNLCTCTGELCNGGNDIKMRLTLSIISIVILAIARNLM